MRFEINYPPTKRAKAAWNKRFGLNAYYSGKHWAQRKKDAEDLYMICRAAMHRAGIKKQILKNPVELTFLFDDNLDCSNHAVLVKAIEDAMKGWIIEDDSRRYVKSITVKFHDAGCIRVIVREIK